MKRPFMNVLPDIVAKFGLVVSRPDLLGYCRENNVSIPALLKQHRAGRGNFDLEPLMKAGDAIYSNPNLGTPSTPYVAPIELVVEDERTDEELEEDINSRFATLDLMTYGVVNGDYRAMIVSGNPGIGKTYSLEYILESAKDAEKIQFTSIRGFVKPTGLYRMLWEHRERGGVVMFDDADSVFSDEVGLNLLKGALDTTKKRSISWMSEKKFEAEDGAEIPQSFDFNGAVVFVTNINFQKVVRSNGKLAPHLDALMSRSFYLDLNLTGLRELILRIKYVIAHSDILSSMDVNKRDQKIILQYIEDKAKLLREVSLRTVIKLGTIWRASRDEDEFMKMANATMIVREGR